MSQTINQHDAKSITQKGGHAENKKALITKNSNLIAQNNELNFNQTKAPSKQFALYQSAPIQPPRRRQW
jgi:hypothetical protein